MPEEQVEQGLRWARAGHVGSSTDISVTGTKGGRERAVRRRLKREWGPIKKDMQALEGLWLLISEMGASAGFCTGK